MTKQPSVVFDVDINNLNSDQFTVLVEHANGAAWAKNGEALYFHSPEVVNETEEDIVVQVTWRVFSSGPSIIYDRTISAAFGKGRRVGQEQTCVDCIFSAACVGGSAMSFQRTLRSWLGNRVYARLGHDQQDFVRSHLKDSTSWEQVPDNCPGVPWGTDRIVQQARADDRTYQIAICARKEG